MTFLIAAILCAGTDCIPVTFTATPGRYEAAVDWCRLHAHGRAYDLARSYIPRVEMTVQPGSIVCEAA